LEPHCHAMAQVPNNGEVDTWKRNLET